MIALQLRLCNCKCNKESRVYPYNNIDFTRVAEKKSVFINETGGRVSNSVTWLYTLCLYKELYFSWKYYGCEICMSVSENLDIIMFFPPLDIFLLECSFTLCNYLPPQRRQNLETLIKILLSSFSLHKYRVFIMLWVRWCRNLFYGTW